jgi:hypothetical protein
VRANDPVTGAADTADPGTVRDRFFKPLSSSITASSGWPVMNCMA